MLSIYAFCTQQNWQTAYDESLVNDKLTVFTNILSVADTYLPFRKIKVCSCDKPWITTKIKPLIRNRQKALHVNGKDSEVYKAYRNAMQTNCSIAKKTFYTCKVAALRSSNVKRWWSEINRLSGKGGSSSPWHLQMLDDQVTNEVLLVERFRQFLGNLTVDSSPLDLPRPGVLYDVPPEFLIDERTAYQPRGNSPSPGHDILIKRHLAPICDH